MHDRRKGSLRQISVLLLCLGLTTSFAYHAIKGRHGLETRSRLIERSSTLEREIRSLETVRAALRAEIALLSRTPPDPDLVSEIAADMLGMVAPGTRVLVPAREPR